MMNFMYKDFGVRIFCNKPCSDENDVNSLLSDNQGTNGFIAEHFVTTPVSLNVCFPFNVNLSKVLVDPNFGSLKSRSFKIFSQSNKMKEELFLRRKDSEMINPILETFDKQGNAHNQIGRVTLTTPSIVIFCNSQYRPMKLFKTNTTELSYSSKLPVVQIELRHHLSGYLTNVNQITLEISQTFNSCTPALKKLEIWGQPASNYSRDFLNTILDIHNKINLSKLPVNVYCHRNEETEINKTNNCNENNISDYRITADTLKIPEEFLDPITCGIMSQPIILPSGKSIDRTTLEKHITSDSFRGKTANDPFTGVPLSSVNYPLINVPLKNRIDKFLLKHATELKNIPRALGRKNLATDEQSNDNRNNLYDVHGCERVSYSSLRRKRPCLDFDMRETKLPNLSSEAKQSLTSHSTITSCRHEHKTQSTLNSLISDILYKRPSFLKQNTSYSCTHFSCIMCSSTDVHTLYRLPCMHVICRSCLIGFHGTELTCKQCQQTCSKHDIIKYHD